MRKHGRIDSNQPEIVGDLRAVGATVVSSADLGDGFPDLIVGYRRQTFLLEVKDPSKPPSKRRLTPDQKSFFLHWRGHVAKVETSEEAILAITGGKYGKG